MVINSLGGQLNCCKIGWPRTAFVNAQQTEVCPALIVFPAVPGQIRRRDDA